MNTFYFLHLYTGLYNSYRDCNLFETVLLLVHLTIVNRKKKWCERYLQFTKNCEFCTPLIVWHLQQCKFGWAVELPRWSTANIKIGKNKSSKCDHASSFSKTSILTIVSNTYSIVLHNTKGRQKFGSLHSEALWWIF